MDETGRLVAVVLLASFAIERVVAVVDFFMTGDMKPDDKRKKFVLVGTAALIAVAVVQLSGIRILATMKFPAPKWIDYFLTWLILVGGADKLGQLLGGGKNAATQQTVQKAQDVPPIKIYLDDKDITPDVTQRR